HADYQSGVAYQARVLIPILADTKETAAVPVLIGALYRQQADATARLAAVQALGQLGDPRAILPCLHALRDNNPAVIAAAAAAAALKHLTGQDLGADHAKWVAWWLKQFAG
ncbi:MAG TPA: HEAT repeat domain-containing protein, partial [Armatimonadota bacterium]